MPLSAQAPSLSIGGYAARHGPGVEALVMLHRRIGVLGRYEGFNIAVEKAVWGGVRFDLVSSAETLVYAAPLVGTHYCYPNNLGGTGSGCGSDPAWNAAVAIMAGFEFAMGSWAIGAEAGRRFVDAGERSRWGVAATVRYTLIGRRGDP